MQLSGSVLLVAAAFFVHGNVRNLVVGGMVNLEEIKGYVERIVFRNEDNGYTVMELDCDGEEQLCVGCAPDVSEGELLLVRGELVINPTYGPQYKMAEYEVLPPEDAKAMERYLGSGAIKGIGQAMAARIVRHFGEDTFRIMEEEPERLAEVKGISEKKALEISNQVAEKRDLRMVIMGLQKYGVTYQLAMKLYLKYGLRINSIIRENPYRLADEVQGIGFLKADEIARQAGISGNSEFRIKSGLLYVLQRTAAEGHMYLPAQELYADAGELLRVDEGELERYVMDLCMDKKVNLKQMGEELRVYASGNYFVERNVARMLRDLNLEYQVSEREFYQRIETFERQTGMRLDDMQRLAVLESVRNGLLIITGGPGTGKTTTIQTIIRYFEQEGMTLRLAAPTGRAAKRMTETTGYEAQTLHRLLELSGGLDGESRGAEFGRNEENPLETDAVIVDEASMIDSFLMHSLLKAVSVGTRLIFVGDVNQLPSVGPGCVLRDMIESGVLPVVRLTKIFRQAMESDIVKNAHRINNGETVDLERKDSRDFFFIEQRDALVMQRAILSLVQNKLPGYVGATSQEIQVLTPMKKGTFGVVELNRLLQRYLNPSDPSKKEKELFERVFREGDKVMQTRNNYQMPWRIVNRYHVVEEEGTGVFNGDVGVIRKIDELLERVVVQFDDNRMADYPFKMMEELELAYAITVHKSQGSEYPAVVMPVFQGPRPLMNRNLLYTAVTRAKSCVAMVGFPEAFVEMVNNESENKRYSGLKDFLQE